MIGGSEGRKARGNLAPTVISKSRAYGPTYLSLWLIFSIFSASKHGILSHALNLRVLISGGRVPRIHPLSGLTVGNSCFSDILYTVGHKKVQVLILFLE